MHLLCATADGTPLKGPERNFLLQGSKKGTGEGNPSFFEKHSSGVLSRQAMRMGDALLGMNSLISRAIVESLNGGGQM